MWSALSSAVFLLEAFRLSDQGTIASRQYCRLLSSSCESVPSSRDFDLRILRILICLMIISSYLSSVSVFRICRKSTVLYNTTICYFFLDVFCSLQVSSIYKEHVYLYIKHALCVHVHSGFAKLHFLACIS